MLKENEMSLPGFGPQAKDDMSKYAVRYLKANLDEADQRIELETVETKGIRGEDIVIIQRQNFTFMDKMFMVLTYLEKVRD
jgi:hypothetical protein